MPLLLALVAVLLIGGGAYVYMQNKQRGQPMAVQTSDWKTYTNSRYGFSFKYPDINARLKSIGGWTDNNEPRITSSRTPFNYNECVLEGDGPGMNGSKITIADREYCLITVFAKEPGPNGPTDSISSSYYEYISRIGNEDVDIAFLASWGADGQQVDQQARLLFSQILATLKLTSSTAQTTNSQAVDWKTYSFPSSNYSPHYQINGPSDLKVISDNSSPLTGFVQIFTFPSKYLSSTLTRATISFMTDSKNGPFNLGSKNDTVGGQPAKPFIINGTTYFKSDQTQGLTRTIIISTGTDTSIQTQSADARRVLLKLSMIASEANGLNSTVAQDIVSFFEKMVASLGVESGDAG